MPESDRPTEPTGWINLGFVERERTLREIIEKGIRHYLAGSSLSNTATLLDDLGVERSRTAIHNWVQKANLQPADGESRDRVAVDQKSIRINDDQYCLYAAVDPQTNKNADDLIGGLRHEGLSYRIQPHGYRNQTEHVFREVGLRISSFSNYFSHVDPSTAETWFALL